MKLIRVQWDYWWIEIDNWIEIQIWGYYKNEIK